MFGIENFRYPDDIGSVVEVEPIKIYVTAYENKEEILSRDCETTSKSRLVQPILNEKSSEKLRKMYHLQLIYQANEEKPYLLQKHLRKMTMEDLRAKVCLYRSGPAHLF